MSCVKCGPSMIMSTNCAVCGGPLTGFDPTGAHPNTSEAMQFCQAAISENDDEQAELAAPRYGYTGRYDVAPAPLKDAAEEGNLAIIKVPCPSWSSPPSNCKPRSRISGRRRLSAKGRISMKHMSTRFPSHAAARFRPSLRPFANVQAWPDRPNDICHKRPCRNGRVSPAEQGEGRSAGRQRVLRCSASALPRPSSA